MMFAISDRTWYRRYRKTEPMPTVERAPASTADALDAGGFIFSMFDDGTGADCNNDGVDAVVVH